MNDKESLLLHLKKLGVITSERIEEAFLSVDRADFVLSEYKDVAYEDTALSIGFGQTISQPYTVAFMLQLLGPKKGERILDVGAGSGWTTALLANIIGKNGHVFGLERIPELVLFGEENLKKYNFTNASIKLSSDKLGLPSEAPFDKILISARTSNIPESLLKQLKVGGTIVLPVGDVVTSIKKVSETDFETKKYPGFLFVPLIES